MNTQITSKLKETVPGSVWMLTKDIDLVYSELDAEEKGTGWYLQKYPGGKCSKLFATELQAINAVKNKTVTFD